MKAGGMILRRLLLLIGGLALLLAGARQVLAAPKDTAAAAAGSNVSYSEWDVTGHTMRLRFILPVSEAAPLLPPKARPDASAVGAAILPLLHVSTAGGDCVAIDQGQGAGQVYVLYRTPGLYRFEIIFDCPTRERMVLRNDVLFDKAPSHVDYASVRLGGGAGASLQMFTQGHRTLALPPVGQPLPDASLVRFLERGAQALIGLPDRLCVLIGLLLVVTGWSDLWRIGAAFALGCVLAFAATLLGLTTDAMAGEAAVGLLAALLAVTALRQDVGPAGWRAGIAPVLMGLCVLAAAAFAAWKAPAALWPVAALALFAFVQAWLAGDAAAAVPGPRRWLVLGPVFLFGALEALGLTRDLVPLPFAPLQLTPILAAYDGGLLAAAIGLLALAVGMLWLLRRRLLPLRPFVLDVAGAALAGLGVFWFVSRLHS